MSIMSKQLDLKGDRFCISALIELLDALRSFDVVFEHLKKENADNFAGHPFLTATWFTESELAWTQEESAHFSKLHADLSDMNFFELFVQNNDDDKEQLCLDDAQPLKEAGYEIFVRLGSDSEAIDSTEVAVIAYKDGRAIEL